MAQYFFNATPAIGGSESEPFEIATLGEARRAAVIFASEILKDSAETLWKDEVRVQVAREDGLILFTIIAVGILSPAGM